MKLREALLLLIEAEKQNPDLTDGFKLYNKDIFIAHYESNFDELKEAVLQVLYWIYTYVGQWSELELLGDEVDWVPILSTSINQRLEALLLSRENLLCFGNENEGIAHELTSNTPFEFTGKGNQARDLMNRVNADRMTINWQAIKQQQSVFLKDVVYYLDLLLNDFYLFCRKFEVC